MHRQNQPLLIIRGVMAFIIVACHIESFLFPVDIASPHLFLFSGSFGVWMFYILSGYFISKSFSRLQNHLGWATLKQFYWFRMRKLLPVYYSTVFFLLITTPASYIIRKGLLPGLLFYYPDIIRDPVFGYLWSAMMIAQWYCIAPLVCGIFMFLQKKEISPVFVGMGIVSFTIGSLVWAITAYDVVRFISYYRMYAAFFPNLSFFLAGCWAHYFLSSKHIVPIRNYHLLLGILILVLGYGIDIVLLYNGMYRGFLSLFALSAPLITIIAGVSSIILFEQADIYVPLSSAYSFHQKSFGGYMKWIGMCLGIFSYEIYLIHFPIVKLVSLSCGTIWCSHFLIILSAIGIISISLGIYASSRLILVRWLRLLVVKA